MQNLTFNKKSFSRTIILFWLLSLAWTILCIATNEFTSTDKGMISGLGFLLLFASSFYFGQPRKSIVTLFWLSIAFILTYLIASYLIGAIIGATTDSMVLYSICSSAFTATTLTLLLNKLYGIQLKLLTLILTFVFALSSYFLMDRLSQYFLVSFDIRPRITAFIFFQGLTIFPLTLGLAVKHNNEKL